MIKENEPVHFILFRYLIQLLGAKLVCFPVMMHLCSSYRYRMRRKRVKEDDEYTQKCKVYHLQSDLHLQKSDNENGSNVYGSDNSKVLNTQEALSRSHHEASSSMKSEVESLAEMLSKGRNRCIPNSASTTYPDNFICLECGLISENKDQFHHHIRIHGGYRKYKCNSCGKRFNRLGHLHSHQNVNKKDNIFECSYCDQRFSQFSSLIRHERIHTGEKPYGCSQCEMRFSNNFSLKRHEKSHSGEKPFSCTVCFQPFSRHDNLITHVRQHHTGEGDRPQVIETVEDPYRLLLN